MTRPAGGAAQARAGSFVARHPRWTLAFVFGAGAVLLAVSFELALRAFGTLNVSYYTGTRLPGVHRFPYGDVPVNSAGYPDSEFDISSPKRRIGYVGDSVTYGIGAGYGYRIPDLLERRFSEYEHWVFGGVGERLDAARLVAQVRQFNLDAVIYLMNLNDIVPDSGSEQASTWAITVRESWFGQLDLALRGRSYLYTYLRFGLKNAFERRGYEHHGMRAFELEPTASRGVIEATARRVAAALAAASRERSLKTCVVVLPYEMQVSKDAAQTYRQLGFSWEAAFEQGLTQQILKASFDELGVASFDGLAAFKAEPKVGETFVYNKGDRTDWNHPNRRGHEILSEWLVGLPDFAARCLSVERSEPERPHQK